MSQIPRQKVIAAGALLGLISAVLVYVFLARQANESTTKYLVVTARQNIERGSIIDADEVQLRSLPKNVLPSKTALTPNAVVGKMTNTRLLAGQPISINDVDQSDRLAHIIPPFKRAVTVALDPIIGVGGFIKPGDHVDVIATFALYDSTVTRTVLQDVELLATGAEVVTSGEANKSDKPDTQPNATLAVMPIDAEKLILADAKGKIRLVLRRADDRSYIHTKGITGRAIIGNVPTDVPMPNTQIQTAQPSTTTTSAAKPEVAANASKPAVKPVATNVSTQKPPMAKSTTKGICATKTKPVQTIEIVRGTKRENTLVSE